MDIHIQFDPSLFSVDAGTILAGPLLAGSNILIFAGSDQATVDKGDIVVSASGIDAIPVPTGTTTVFQFQVHVKPGVALGTQSSLNLVLDAPLNGGSTPAPTKLNRLDGSTIPLSPEPSNGANDSVDGLVTVSAVPEPTSLGLLGAGGLLALALHARRRRRPSRP